MLLLNLSRFGFLSSLPCRICDIPRDKDMGRKGIEINSGQEHANTNLKPQAGSGCPSLISTSVAATHRTLTARQRKKEILSESWFAEISHWPAQSTVARLSL